MGDMNRSSRSQKCLVPLSLSWTHGRDLYRLTPWPEVRLERSLAGEWIPVAPTLARLQAAESHQDGPEWRAYLEFVPAAVREFVALFRRNRLVALQVAARCPDAVGALTDTPALISFVAAQAVDAAATHARWNELNAVHERGGIFAIMEWVGLPASRNTLSILRNLVAPDLPNSLLDPLRSTLWKPEGVFALAQLPTITDRDLTDACALAA